MAYVQSLPVNPSQLYFLNVLFIADDPETGNYIGTEIIADYIINGRSSFNFDSDLIQPVPDEEREDYINSLAGLVSKGLVELVEVGSLPGAEKKKYSFPEAQKRIIEDFIENNNIYVALTAAGASRMQISLRVLSPQNLAQIKSSIIKGLTQKIDGKLLPNAQVLELAQGLKSIVVELSPLISQAEAAILGSQDEKPKRKVVKKDVNLNN